jgi:SecD/SecF fusion protein
MKTTRSTASALLAVALTAAVGCSRAPQERTVLVYAFDIPAGQQGKPDINQVVAVLKRRVNQCGVKEATVRARGSNEVEIVVPVVDNATGERLKGVIRRRGSIEFRILANKHDDAGRIDRGMALKPNVAKLYGSNGKLEAWWVPVNPWSDRELTYPKIARRTVTQNGKQVVQILVINDPFDVTGSYLIHVGAETDQRGRPGVTFQFNSTGGKKFAGLTSAHLPDAVTGFTRKLGIILDGELYSAPSIQSTIYDRGEITGSFTKRDTEDLASVLDGGALPVALKIVSERREKR